MGGADKMLAKFKARTDNNGQIVAIRDIYTPNRVEFYETYGLSKEKAKTMHTYMKKYKLDGCVVMKIKKDVFGVMQAFGKMFQSGSKNEYCSAFTGFPMSMQVGKSDALGKVVVVYYDSESG